jgi:hypothetical protein
VASGLDKKEPGRMIVCADDYGLSGDIDEAILTLAESRRLSAVSCMVLLERLEANGLARLRAHESHLDLGLHLCLTDESLPLSPLPGASSPPARLPQFKDLFSKAIRRNVNTLELLRQVSGQYQLFVEKTSRRPDYIDGHLHVHQLPGIREALIEFLLSLPAGSRPYIRNTWASPIKLWRLGLPWLKSSLIGCFGVSMLRKLQGAGLATISGFAGSNDFSEWEQYPAYFPKFAASLGHPNGILVVHPGSKEAWRAQEFSVLREFAFASGQPQRFEKATNPGYSNSLLG